MSHRRSALRQRRLLRQDYAELTAVPPAMGPEDIRDEHPEETPSEEQSGTTDERNPGPGAETSPGLDADPESRRGEIPGDNFPAVHARHDLGGTRPPGPGRRLSGSTSQETRR